MSLARIAKRRDKAEPAIIQALEQAGFEVTCIDKPCDLLVRKPSDPPGHFKGLEVKTSRKKNGQHVNLSHKPQRDAQERVLVQLQIPVVTTPVEALKAVGAI